MSRIEDTTGFIAAFTGSHHYIVDYLVAEVLSRQPEQVRSFLLQRSILGQITGDLCDRLTGGSDSQATSRYLETANLFDNSCDIRRRRNAYS